jgi:hypothetical protein
VGPPLLPEWHVSLSLHHPQFPRSVQVAQLPLELHESPGFAHDDRVPAQLVQVRPIAGPASVPDMHVRLLRHHPHPGVVVHPPQSVRDAQGSAPTLQADASPAHIALHMPIAGPLRAALAVTQRLAAPHQPQPERARQAPQPDSTSQVSVGFRQVTDENAHPETQRPSMGPAELPGTQMLVPPHQPQPPKDVQSPQLAARAQGPAGRSSTAGASPSPRSLAFAVSSRAAPRSTGTSGTSGAVTMSKARVTSAVTEASSSSPEASSSRPSPTAQAAVSRLSRVSTRTRMRSRMPRPPGGVKGRRPLGGPASPALGAPPPPAQKGPRGFGADGEAQLALQRRERVEQRGPLRPPQQPPRLVHRGEVREGLGAVHLHRHGLRQTHRGVPLRAAWSIHLATSSLI